MKENTYLVWFSNCNYKPEFVKVRATNQGNALILAMAERIKEGSDYTLERIDALDI